MSVEASKGAAAKPSGVRADKAEQGAGAGAATAVGGGSESGVAQLLDRRPELAVAGAFAGGVLVAIALRALSSD